MAFFCCSACKSGYSADLAHGAMYGAHALTAVNVTRVLMRGRSRYSEIVGICAYCGAELEIRGGRAHRRLDARSRDFSPEASEDFCRAINRVFRGRA